MTLESKSTSSTKKKKSNNFDIYLASSSPRRSEILKNLAPRAAAAMRSAADRLNMQRDGFFNGGVQGISRAKKLHFMFAEFAGFWEFPKISPFSANLRKTYGLISVIGPSLRNTPQYSANREFHAQEWSVTKPPVLATPGFRVFQGIFRVCLLFKRSFFFQFFCFLFVCQKSLIA